jgi:hypothetical protein
MNVRRLIKAGTLVLMVISASTLRASEIKEIDWKYDVTYSKKKVGHSRIVLRSSIHGEQLFGMSNLVIPSFFEDSHIYSFSFESYNVDGHLMRSEYAYLYNEYLFRIFLEVSEGEQLRKNNFIYKLDSANLLLVQEKWAHNFEKLLSKKSVFESFLKNIKNLIPVDSSMEKLRRNLFDMTLFSLSLRLPEESFKKQKKPIRIFDPASEESNPFYNISIKSEIISTKNSKELNNIKKNVQKFSVVMSSERLIEYWYDLNTKPASLLKIVDSSSGETIEIEIVK